MNKKTKSTNNLSSMAVIVTMCISITTVGYGLIQWVDNRYINTERFYSLSVRTAITMFDQHINDLRAHERFLLEFRPKEYEEIKATRKQIDEIKKHRKYFLETGHYPVGDEILLDQYLINNNNNKKQN